MAEKGGMKIVLLMCLGIFVCMLDSTIMNITLPAIQNDLKTTLETSSWMLNVYTITIAVLAIPMARFAELFGRNKFFLAGLFIFGSASALCGFADNGNLLIGARFLQSLGASILIPCSMIIGISAMPLEKRRISQTLLGATQGLSTALGPTVGGFLTEKMSWHWVFFVNIPICIMAIMAGFLLLNLKNETRVREKMDWIGLIFSFMTIFPLNLVLIKGNTWGWESSYAILCYFTTAICFALFLVAEKKSKAPMVNLNLFKDRLFTGASILALTGFIFLIGVMVLLPQFLTNFQNKTELNAALLVTPVSASIFVFSTIAGILINRIGYTVSVIFGFGMMGVAYYLLHNLTIHSTSKEIIILCSLLGFGFSFVITVATIASSSSFEGEMLTASQGVFSMIRQVGVVLAVAIFVSGLTHNMNLKKQEVIAFASKKSETLDLPKPAKGKILEETKKIINTEEKTKHSKPDIMTKKEREQLIEMIVQKELAKIPEDQRSLAKDRIYQQASKQVDQEVLKKEKAVTNYSKQVSSFAKTNIAFGFADLYKASIPFVFLSGLSGLVFYKKRLRYYH